VTDDVRSMWEANATAWIEMSRAGYDVYRDLVNTPAFLTMLPDVSGLVGLDLGCGEGHNTRLVARRGARMVGVDLAAPFVRAAADKEGRGSSTRYLHADGAELPVRPGAVDFVVAFMSLMDMADPTGALREAHRVLRPGGFVQYSVLHPLTLVPYRRWIHGDGGDKVALAIGGYFDPSPLEETWTFSTAPEELRRRHDPLRTQYVRRTVAGWLNETARAGFVIEEVGEPCADEPTASTNPEVADTRIVPYFLIVRARRVDAASRSWGSSGIGMSSSRPPVTP
jgi:ubiquinone/menaquinone biosynthesis C-methylase UbiE